MAFMTSEVCLFRKKSKVILDFALFFFFVHLLNSLIKERLRTILLGFEKGLTEQIFGGRNMALRLR